MVRKKNIAARGAAMNDAWIVLPYIALIIAAVLLWVFVERAFGALEEKRREIEAKLEILQKAEKEFDDPFRDDLMFKGKKVDEEDKK